MTYDYGKVTIQSISILCKDGEWFFGGYFVITREKTSEQWLLATESICFCFAMRTCGSCHSLLVKSIFIVVFCFDLRMESIIELGCAYNAGLFCADLLV